MDVYQETVNNSIKWIVAAIGGVILWFVRLVMSNRELINTMEKRIIRIETQVEHLFRMTEDGNKMTKDNSDMLKVLVGKKIK